MILLGVVSVATAYTSFQSGLYGGASDDRISKSEAAGTEAESLYLEGNQQYQKDAQTIGSPSCRRSPRRAPPGDRGRRRRKYDELYFIAVTGTDLEPRSTRPPSSTREPDFYHDPQADETYQAALFSGYGDEKLKSDDLRTEGDKLGDTGRPARVLHRADGDHAVPARHRGRRAARGCGGS